MATIEGAELRRALGAFATGVTVVTTSGRDGAPVGVTANSFNSVSLDPPMVLWSLANTSRSMDAFAGAEHFAVHVLGADQEALSNRFASRGSDKFAGVECDGCEQGIPLLQDCAARFVCRTAYKYEGGDHTIFVGEVLDVARRDKAPLLFHGGKYADARQRAVEPPPPGVDPETGFVDSNFFLYLVPAVYFQATYPVRALLRELGVGDAENLTLALVNNHGSMSEAELLRRMEHTGLGASAATLRAMQAKGWLDSGDSGDHWRLTDAGRSLFLHVLTRMIAHEQWLLSHFATHEVAELKGLMKRMLAITAQAMPPSLGTL